MSKVPAESELSQDVKNAYACTKQQQSSMVRDQSAELGFPTESGRDKYYIGS